MRRLIAVFVLLLSVVACGTLENASDGTRM